MLSVFILMMIFFPDTHVQDQFGHLEIDDQVTGLLSAASTVPYIDVSRVAITGWSYGGYLSLMGLALRPDIFKVGVARG